MVSNFKILVSLARAPGTSQIPKAAATAMTATYSSKLRFLTLFLLQIHSCVFPRPIPFTTIFTQTISGGIHDILVMLSSRIRVRAGVRPAD
jgi:hypothetical protein